MSDSNGKGKGKGTDDKGKTSHVGEIKELVVALLNANISVPDPNQCFSVEVNEKGKIVVKIDPNMARMTDFPDDQRRASGNILKALTLQEVGDIAIQSEEVIAGRTHGKILTITVSDTQKTVDKFKAALRQNIVGQAEYNIRNVIKNAEKSLRAGLGEESAKKILDEILGGVGLERIKQQNLGKWTKEVQENKPDKGKPPERK
ncbi:MAG: hypothetical protein ABL857_02705 [Rickettsiales bacterium]|jgi:hypothetical protein